MKASKRQGEAVAATPEGAEAQSGAAQAQVTLPANCSIRDCGALKIDLSAVLSVPAPVSIEVSALERIDTAAIQLLCAFVRDRKGQKLEVVWSGKSAALTEAARLLGVETVLGVATEASDVMVSNG